MDLTEIQTQVFKLSQEMTLTLDNPKSVKLQIKQINFIQKQLRSLKKELNLIIREINQQAAQSRPDSIVSVGLDLFGKRKLAGQMRASMRRTIEAEKVNLRQPYIDVKNQIEQSIIYGDKIKLEAEQYLLNQ